MILYSEIKNQHPYICTFLAQYNESGMNGITNKRIENVFNMWKIKERTVDKSTKILLLMTMFVPFVLYALVEYSFYYYAGSIISNINISSGLTNSFTPILTAGFCLSLFFFAGKMSRSNFNDTKIEMAIGSFFSNTFVIKSKEWVFYALLVLASVLFTCAFIDAIVSSANEVRQYTGINLVTLEKNSYFNHTFVMNLIFSLSILTISFLLIATRPKKISNNFLMGFILVPIIINFLFNFSFMEIASYGDSFPNELSEFSQSYTAIFMGIEFIFPLLSLVYIAFILFNIMKNKSEDSKGLIHDLKIVFLAYSMTWLSALLVGFFLMNSPTIEHFHNDQNVMAVNVHGTDYVINQTLLSEMEDRETEYLIEGYVGLGIHNSMSSLEYMLSENYTGDKEKSIRFVADILFTNFTEYDKKSVKLVSLFKNERLDISAVMNLLVPFVIYESSPFHHQKRTLESVINGNYQKAIDYYIEDALNRTDVELLPLDMGSKENNERIGSFGHPLLKGIISSLIKNDMAVIDYDKIIESKREKAKKLISGFTGSSYDAPSDEKIEYWYKIFKTERLFK